MPRCLMAAKTTSSGRSDYENNEEEASEQEEFSNLNVSTLGLL